MDSRIENALYAVLASPMIVSFDLSTLNSPKQAFAKKMLLDTEMIAINQVLCVCARARPIRMSACVLQFRTIRVAYSSNLNGFNCCDDAIAQDPDVVMASKVYTHGRNSWMTDVRTPKLTFVHS